MDSKTLGAFKRIIQEAVRDELTAIFAAVPAPQPVYQAPIIREQVQKTDVDAARRAIAERMGAAFGMPQQQVQQPQYYQQPVAPIVPQVSTAGLAPHKAAFIQEQAAKGNPLAFMLEETAREMVPGEEINFRG